MFDELDEIEKWGEVHVEQYRRFIDGVTYNME